VKAALANEAKAWMPAEQVQRTLKRRNCISCHQSGGLTGVGAKLNARRLREVIANGAPPAPRC
jgi:mono/diheme cytochrome c family protein